MKSVLTVFLLIIAQSAHASLIEDVDLKQMMSSKTLSELRLTVQRSKQIEEARAVCKFQLDGEKIPSNCFEAIELERKSRVLGPKEHSREFHWLNEVCLRRAASSDDRKDLNRAIENRNMPTACRELAVKKRDDLRYADQMARPVDLFESRFQKNSNEAVIFELKTRIQNK